MQKNSYSLDFWSSLFLHAYIKSGNDSYYFFSWKDEFHDINKKLF